MTALSRIDVSSALSVVTGQSNANTALTLTIPAESGKRHFVAGFDLVATGGTQNAEVIVELKDGGTVVYSTVVVGADGASLRVYPAGAIQCGRGNAVTLEVAAGGTDVVEYANILYFTL